MAPRSPALAALLLAVSWRVQAAPMCLKPGSLGPDVPNCSAYQDGPAARTAIPDNLLALAGEAAAESFNERAALDAAGPIRPQSLAARSKTSTSKAAALAAFGVSAAPTELGSAGLGKSQAEYEQIAGDIVKGTGNAFQSLEPAAKTAAASAVTPAARAQSAVGSAAAASAAGTATPMNAGAARRETSIGQLGAITDPGRQVFDQAASGLAEDVSPGAVAAPRAPTVRECTILHPCAKAN